MSGQIPDIIVIDDVEYAVVEPSPGVLFEPRDHGVFPVHMHSASSRGELARYRVNDGGQLLLSDLQVGHDGQPAELNGITATTDEHAQTWTYLKLDISIDFSGDLVAGARPIRCLLYTSDAADE